MSLPLRTKRGLAWPVDNHATDPVHTFTKPGSQISWLYNWSPHPTPSSASLAFIRMQWNHISLPSLSALLPSAPASAVPILVFNEPERSDQASLSPEDAASHWMAHIEPLRRANRILAGSPGISSAEDGVRWLESFLRLIRAHGSDVDFLALHWYGETLGGFYDYLWSTRFRLDETKRVWVTEFACTNWSLEYPVPGEVVGRFMRESVKYLDSLEWVEAYAWFGAMRDCGTVGPGARLLDEAGRITELGREYRDGR